MVSSALRDGRLALKISSRKAMRTVGNSLGVALEVVGLGFGNRQRAEYFFRGGKLGQQVFRNNPYPTASCWIVGLNTQRLNI